MTALLEMCSITKEFSGVRALDGVTFDLRTGVFHSLVGENGAGKSTLISTNWRNKVWRLFWFLRNCPKSLGFQTAFWFCMKEESPESFPKPMRRRKK